MPAGVLAALAWAWLLLAAPALTNVAAEFFTAFLLGATWLALALCWLCLPFSSPGLLCSRRWLAAVAPITLGLLLALTDLGLLARVALGRGSLEAYAAAIPEGTDEPDHQPRRVGLFLIDGTESPSGAVLLYTSRSFIHRHGLALIPPDAEVPPRVRKLRRLVGNWHSFEWYY